MEAPSLAVDEARVEDHAPLPLTRSDHEIDGELFKLYGLLRSAPATTEYGEPITLALRAQIDVLRRRMTTTEAVDIYEEHDLFVLSAVLDAVDWLRDDSQALSMDWQSVLGVMA